MFGVANLQAQLLVLDLCRLDYPMIQRIISKAISTVKIIQFPIFILIGLPIVR